MALDRIADGDRKQHSQDSHSQWPAGPVVGWGPRTAPRLTGGPTPRHPREKRRREDGQAEDEGGSEVAEAGLEAARQPLWAGSRGRGNEPGDDHRKASEAGNRQRSSAVRRKEAKQQPTQSESRNQGPEDGETAVQARQEPVGPDGAVGQVAEDVVAFSAAEGLIGRGERDRAEAVELGQWVAGVDQVTEIPVAAPGQGRETARGKRSPAAAYRRYERKPQDENSGR